MTFSSAAGPSKGPATAAKPPGTSNSRTVGAQLGVTGITLILVLIAVGPVVVQSFLDRPLYHSDAVWTFGNFGRLFTLPEIGGMVGDTLLFCTIAIAFSMFVGVFFSILVGRTDLPAAGLFLNVFLWPLFISPLVIAFGAIMAYGPAGVITGLANNLFGPGKYWDLYTITGIAVISGVTMVPTTILYCLSAAQAQDPSHETAARVAGAPALSILRRITLPMMRPALVYAVIMNVVAALEMLAIPLILGAPVGIHLLTTFIYERGFETGTPDYGLVAAAAIVLMFFLGGLLFLQNALLARSHRFISVGTKVGRPMRLPLGKLRWPMFAVVALYLFVTVGIVLGTVFVRAFTHVLSPYVPVWSVLTFDNFVEIYTVPAYFNSIVNTLMIAVLTALIGTALFTAVALVSQRSTFRFRKVLDALVQLPRVLPGIMIGLGVFYASVFIPGLEVLRNSIWLLVLAYLIRYMSVGYGVVAPALMQVTTDFDRAAKVTGAGWTTIVTRIIVPIIRPALQSCLVLLLIQSTKEYAAAIFLFAPGSEVIGSTMLTLWVQGLAGPVAALAVIQIAIVTVLILIANRFLGVKLHG